MDNPQLTVHRKEQITAACHTLHTPYDTVKLLFQDKDLTEINLSGIQGKDTMPEVRFKNATLNCLFDQNNICIGSVLFLDNPANIFNYIVRRALFRLA